MRNKCQIVADWASVVMRGGGGPLLTTAPRRSSGNNHNGGLEHSNTASEITTEKDSCLNTVSSNDFRPIAKTLHLPLQVRHVVGAFSVSEENKVSLVHPVRIFLFTVTVLCLCVCVYSGRPAEGVRATVWIA